MIDLLLYGALCALMVELARHAPVEQRRQAVAAAGLLCINWVWFSLAWSPYAPAHLLHQIGVDASHEDMWMLGDALAGAASLAVAFDRTWSWALWGLLFGQVLTVSWAVLIGSGYQSYCAVLNCLFYGQIAVFAVIGGRGIVDRINRNLGRLRNVFRPARTTYSREKPPS